MKRFENYLMAIEWNDYMVTVISDDNYNILQVIAEEDINEGKNHTFKAGEEVKMSKSDIRDFSETLREENTPFKDDEAIDE